MRSAGDDGSGTQVDLARREITEALDQLELVPYDDPRAAAGPALELAQRADALGLHDLVHRARLVHADVIGRQGDTAGAGPLAPQGHEWAPAPQHRPPPPP